MGKVRVINLHVSYSVNERLVKKIAAHILKLCGDCGRMELDLVFLSDKQIRPLNKKYKGEDSPTDVLSFELGEEAPGTRRLGEIIVSIDKARKNSGIYGNDLKKEFVLYIIHGILHLTGYDDLSAKQRSRMEARQEEVLDIICKREDLSKVLTPR